MENLPNFARLIRPRIEEALKNTPVTLAQTSGQMCNYAKLGGEVGLDGKTAAKYINIFDQLYLLKRVNVWASNRLNRLVKTPKLQFMDSGLLAALLNLSIEEINENRTRSRDVTCG